MKGDAITCNYNANDDDDGVNDGTKEIGEQKTLCSGRNINVCKLEWPMRAALGIRWQGQETLYTYYVI